MLNLFRNLTEDYEITGLVDYGCCPQHGPQALFSIFQCKSSLLVNISCQCYDHSEINVTHGDHHHCRKQRRVRAISRLIAWHACEPCIFLQDCHRRRSLGNKRGRSERSTSYALFPPPPRGPIGFTYFTCLNSYLTYLAYFLYLSFLLALLVSFIYFT